MRCAVVLAAGVLLGASVAVLSVNAWPKVRLAPELVTHNRLHFGTANDGAAALCDEEDNAYRPQENGTLYTPVRRAAAPPSSGLEFDLVPLTCESGR